jgi:hypothetical protein
MLLLPAVIRKDLVLVEGAIGNCNTQVTPGQLLQQLQPVAKKGPRVVSLEVRHCSIHRCSIVSLCWAAGSKLQGAGASRCCSVVCQHMLPVALGLPLGTSVRRVTIHQIIWLT